MDRRGFLKAAGASLASLAISGPTQARGRKGANGKPNIIFIMADDMGYGDPRCYNPDSKIPTPNMDRLAANGVRFTDAHSPSAVCTPTRYGVLTGRYCWRSRLKRGVLGGYSPLLIEKGRMTVASMLKDHGYATACIGKWHLGIGEKGKADFSKPLKPGPNSVGFDYFFGISASLDMPPYCYIENERALPEPTENVQEGKSTEDGWWRPGAVAPGFKHVDVLPDLTKKAVQYIDDHMKNKPDQPFFMYFPLAAPHCPIAPADFVKGKSQAGGYGDFVVEVDWTLGQVVEAIKNNGIAGNTLLIMTSDNGSPARTKIKREPYTIIEEFGHNPSGQLRGIKADIWDGGHRVPFIASWPGKIEAGTVCDEIACLTDITATCAAIVGQELPADAAEDSFNMLPALLGKNRRKPIRDAVVHHSLSGMFSIRQGNWKLAMGMGSGGFTKPQTIKPKPGEPQGQLFDLQKDPAEKNNLWADRADVVDRLTKLLEECKKQGYTRPMR